MSEFLPESNQTRFYMTLIYQLVLFILQLLACEVVLASFSSGHQKDDENTKVFEGKFSYIGGFFGFYISNLYFIYFSNIHS